MKYYSRKLIKLKECFNNEFLLKLYMKRTENYEKIRLFCNKLQFQKCAHKIKLTSK